MQPHILVPYDFSPCAECALRWAAEFKRSVGGGSIRLVYVQTALPAVGAVSALPLLTPPEDEIEEPEAALRQVAARLCPDAQIELRQGPEVAAQLLSAAAEPAAGLIVMGTHGRGGVKRLVLGSVADSVVRRATCPVVTVREPST